MPFFNPLSEAFGLDIGDRTFKLVQVAKKGHKNDAPRLVAWGSIDVPEGIMDRGDIKDVDKAVERVTTLLKSAKGKVTGRAVVACLPEAKTFIKIIEVKKDSSVDEQRKAVVGEIERNIPLPLSEIYFDWQIVDDASDLVPTAVPSPDAKPTTITEPANAPQLSARIIIGAAPKSLVDDYTALLEKAGLAPLALEIEAMAIARAIVPEGEHHDDAVGILDIGATRSSLVISDVGALRMSISIPISGIAITKMVSDALQVSMDDAETLKRECGLDAERCEDKMWKIIQPLIDDMSDKIRNALRFYKIGFPDGKKIERVYLCGGGAKFHEIDSVLSRMLTIQVFRGNALVNLDQRLPKDFATEDSLQYATAIGLGLRASEENARQKGPLS